MPTYEYKCNNCGEYDLKQSDKFLSPCEDDHNGDMCDKCEAEIFERIVSNFNWHWGGIASRTDIEFSSSTVEDSIKKMRQNNS